MSVTYENNVKYFIDRGFSKEDIRVLEQKHQNVFWCSTDDDNPFGIPAKIRFLKRFEIEDNKINEMIQSFPKILTCSVGENLLIKKRIVDKYVNLFNYIIENRPRDVLMSVELFFAKVRFFEDNNEDISMYNINKLMINSVEFSKKYGELFERRNENETELDYAEKITDLLIERYRKEFKETYNFIPKRNNVKEMSERMQVLKYLGLENYIDKISEENTSFNTWKEREMYKTIKGFSMIGFSKRQLRNLIIANSNIITVTQKSLENMVEYLTNNGFKRKEIKYLVYENPIFVDEWETALKGTMDLLNNKFGKENTKTILLKHPQIVGMTEREIYLYS